MIEFEKESKSHIPEELSQRNLPMSFRYYDPIINLIKKRISEESKDYFKIRKDIAITYQ
jgi:hypothetical protein